ncbi:esterase B1-like [Maniola hyperantus]|uniref:esterase B1-like n=1 Tax=Aphantopus hyperantus TaxID=2795564 RepID=UPI00374A0FC5
MEVWISRVFDVKKIFQQTAASVVVRVEQGELRGEQKWTITGDKSMYSFKGIPYAAAPVGDLRFKAPQPAPAWQGIRNASEHGNVCPQFDMLRNQLVPGSEDCLFLNVYTPSLDEKSRLPVLFVIPGGAFVWGSGNDDIYGADWLMNKKDIVVVTFNYRLDNLGFLCMDTADVPGNAAMKDQVAALRWVRKNIQKFGGDPYKVTLFGESAGAMSCMYHALSPMSRGLFQRIIAMSGEALNDYFNAFEPQRRPFVLAKSLGFESANTTTVLEFLQSVPATDLIHNPNANTVLAVEQYATFKFIYSVPVVEKDFGQERFLTEPYEVSLKKGLSEVDILMGFTSEEGVFFIPAIETTPTLEYHDRYPEALVPLSVSRHSTPKRNLEIADSIKEHYTGSKTQSLNTIPLFVPLITDSFIYLIIRYANILLEYSPKNKIYLYENALMSERNQYRELSNKYGFTGMSHFDDLQYIFQSYLYHSSGDKTAPSYEMIRMWCAMVTNFMIHGNPTPDASLSVTWPPYNRESKQYLYIGEELQVCKNPRQSTVDFYDAIYPKV